MKLKLYATGLTGLVGIMLFSIYAFDAYHQPVYQPIGYSALEHSTGRADYNAQYYHMLREDFRTGKIDFKEVLQARRDVEQFLGRSEKNSASSLHWDYKGPDFVGGRCRALIQDNQSVNSAIMYAGGVSGGFFISFDRGETWHDNSGDLPSLAISCVTQSLSGTVFVGTGSSHEGLSGAGYKTETGHPGDGLFRRDPSGNGYTFKRLIGPDVPNSGPSATWRYVNQIAASPTDANKLYIGGQGMWYSTNALADQPEIKKFPNFLGSGDIDDIVVSNDGQFIYFSTGSVIYKFQDNGGDNLVEVNSYTLSSGTGNIGRIMLALAPSDNNVIYAAVSGPSGNWSATTGCLYGIFQSKDAGITWNLIGPGGSYFDPYANPGTNCQGDYDNTIAVYPNDPGRILVGGVQLWKWQESSVTPGIGGWSQIAVTQGGSLIDSNYVHADKHRIIFTSPNTIYIASDGGIGKSTDGGNSWSQVNFGFNITQFYSIAAAGALNTVFQGDTFVTEQIMGGTQDNGTQFVGWNIERPKDPIEIKGGDGFDCAFSELGNLAFASVYNGEITRHSFGNAGGERFYDEELDSACYRTPGGCGAFYTRMEYWETAYAPFTFDSVKVYSTQAVTTSDTLTYVSNIGAVPHAYPPYRNMVADDSIMMPDFTQSKLAMVSNTGIYMTRDAAKVNTVRFKWDRIASGASTSYPDPLEGSVMSMAFSADGNHLYVATVGSSGFLYRISNLNVGYDSLTLDERSSACVLTCTKIGVIPGGGRPNDIAVDPNNADNVVIACGGFSRSAAHVYRVTDASTATSNSATISSIQGDLPQMPVYAALIADHSENTILIGTEFGIYGTDNGWSGNPSWTPAMGGMPIVPTYALVQQQKEFLYSSEVEETRNIHYRKVYAGTCGRGFYSTNQLVGIDEKDAKPVAASKNQVYLKVYPNPLNTNGTIELSVPSTQHAVVQIFDLNGKLVRTVHNGTMQAGSRKIAFDVSTMHTGTYIASVRTDEGMKVAKFVVMK